MAAEASPTAREETARLAPTTTAPALRLVAMCHHVVAAAVLHHDQTRTVAARLRPGIGTEMRL